MLALRKEDAISSFYFDWNKQEKNFIGEMSEVAPLGLVNRKIFDDAVDVGFLMKSAKTGDFVMMVLSETNKDDEDEVLTLRYEAYGLDSIPLGFGCILIND